MRRIRPVSHASLQLTWSSEWALCVELPELLGVRTIPMQCDLRIGIATGEALVGSIGSEFMMSYTVMGDTVNLASRLEAANKAYGSHCLVSGATVAAAKDAAIEVREIDRVVVLGQSQPQVIFEIMGRRGELASNAMQLRTRYEEGLTAYRAGLGRKSVPPSTPASQPYPATDLRRCW